MSGLSFSLGGSKRTAPAGVAKAQPPKKPAKVSDLFGADSGEEDEPEQDVKKQRTTSSVGAGSSSPDPEVLKAAERLAEFVAKNGRSFEDMTRLRNPGNDGPFRFLHNKQSPEYIIFDRKVREIEASLGKGAPQQPSQAAYMQPPIQAPVAQYAPPHAPPPPPYAAPAAPYGTAYGGPAYAAPAAPYTAPYAAAAAPMPAQQQAGSSQAGRASRWAPQPPAAPAPRSTSAAGPRKTQEEEDFEVTQARRAQAKGDSVAAMEAYAKLMAKKQADKEEQEEEDRKRSMPLLNETSFDRRKVTAVFKQDGTRGHHMSDFIPAEELAKLLAKGGDAQAKAAAEALEKKNAIQSDNIGHKLLSKMGWKEGEGVGASRSGITAPVQAGSMNQNNLGLGAQAHGEVTEGDDAFEQYRKRMMLGYKHRPNPLGNPRKAYY